MDTCNNNNFNRMNNSILLILCLAVSFILFTGCEKNNDETKSLQTNHNTSQNNSNTENNSEPVNYPLSCEDALHKNIPSNSGVIGENGDYIIDADGPGGEDPVVTYCVFIGDKDHPLNQIQPGFWYAAPESKLYDERPDPMPSGNTQAVMKAWSSAAFDTKRNRLIIWGGGHGDYAGNELYIFDVASLSWQRIWGPTPSDQIQDSSMGQQETYLDGNPVSRHTYDGLVYLPEPYDALWAQAGSRYPFGYGTYATWLFSFKDLTWTQLSDCPESHLGISSAYDPVSGHVFLKSLYQMYEYIPSVSGALNDSYVKHIINPDGWTINHDNTTATVIPSRRLMIFIGGHPFGGDVYVSHYGIFDLESKEYSVPDFTGDVEIVTGDAPGVAYDSKNDRIVAYMGGTAVYVLNLDTWKWTRVEAHTSSSEDPGDASPTGTYGRFQYIAEYDVFIVVNSVHSNVHFIRVPVIIE